MEWVAIDVHIAGNAVTHRLAEEFRLRVAEAAGLLALTFAGMAQHTPDGCLADVPNSQIEAWAYWHGKRGKYAAFFREHLCDEQGMVTDWEEWNGASMRAAESSRERSRRWREVRKKERDARELAALQHAEGTAIATPNSTPERTAFGTDTERVANASTGQDKTGQSFGNRPPAAREREPGEFETLLLGKLGDAERGAVDQFLGARPSEKRDAWAKEMLTLLMAGSPEDLARTCTDAHLAEPPVTNAKTLRTFFAFCRRERVAGDRGQGVAGTIAGDAVSHASVLWSRYKGAGLLSRWPADEVRRRGEQLVAAGDYPDIEAFQAEIARTKPWELGDARTDGWGINELAKRLAAPVRAAS